MNVSHKTVDIFSLSLTLLLPLVATAQVQVHDEPLHHPVFSSKELRVLDVKANAGDTSLMHQHANNYCYVTMKGGTIWVQTEGENGRTVELKTGFIGGYFGNPSQTLIHRFANQSDSLIRLIAVENLSKAGNRSDTVSTLLDNEELIIENDFFRVTKIQLRSKLRAVVQLKNSSIFINLDQRPLRYSEGHKTSTFTDWIYRVSHRSTTLTNPLSTDAFIILVQVKDTP